MIKRDYVKHMACRKYWISRNYVLLILISFSFRSLQETQEQDLCLNPSFNPQSLLNEHCQVLQTFWGFVIRWFFSPRVGSFTILSNPTSNAHLYQWKTEMYPQEKRHKLNTLSFLNNRSDSKRFSLSSPHPNPLLCCRPWAGPGNRTRQSEGRVSAQGGAELPGREALG